jgi:hypothetical protein
LLTGTARGFSAAQRRVGPAPQAQQHTGQLGGERAALFTAAVENNAWLVARLITIYQIALSRKLKRACGL